MSPTGRNEPCPCGSGEKYKRCCGLREPEQATVQPRPRSNIRETFQTALRHHQAGRLAEAKALYHKILQGAPKEADTLHLLGLIAHAEGDHDRAIELISESVEIAPLNAEAHYNLGVVLQDQGADPEAVTSYRKAISLNPEHAGAHYNLGNILQEDDALTEAERCYRRAIALNPIDPAAHDNLGTVLHRLGKPDEAVASYRRALSLGANDPETHNNLGITLHDQGQLMQAEGSYHAALALKPDFAEAWSNLGAALFTQFRAAEAVAACEKAIALDPYLVKAHNNRGIALSVRGQLEPAAESFRRALDIDPDFVQARGNLLFVHNYRLDIPPARMLHEARIYGSQLRRWAKPYDSWKGTSDPERPLRVGFVSADLADHPVGYFLESVLRELSRVSLRLVAFPTHLGDDPVHRRLRTLFDEWCPVVGMSDEEAARLIHDDAIDILVDLSGHTAGNRLPVFAWKPAPIQATWLGYFATTGVEEIDYLIADPWTVPESENAQFTEKVWRLPDTRLCFTAPDADVEVSSLPALANGYVTFGCFNNLAKVNDSVVALWARVLSAVPESRLLIKARQLAEDSTRQSVRERFAAQGIEGERLVLEPPSQRAEYLAAYARIDIALDPFPFPGGTTTVEALWMGVPVLTLAGERMISRQGVSLLMNAGLPDWAASDADDYVARAGRTAAGSRARSFRRLRLRPPFQRSSAASMTCSLTLPTIEIASEGKSGVDGSLPIAAHGGSPRQSAYTPEAVLVASRPTPSPTAFARSREDQAHRGNSCNASRCRVGRALCATAVERRASLKKRGPRNARARLATSKAVLT
jgi:predicted O-linked N-acetylglucosamine transferase (SPINDLY family)